MDLSEVSLEELKELEAEVKEAIVAKKTQEKETKSIEKDERAEAFRNTLGVGDIVLFLYGRDDIEQGKVIRVSDKTVTVESEVFPKGKNYVRFDRFVEVLESAETEEDTEDAD